MSFTLIPVFGKNKIRRIVWQLQCDIKIPEQLGEQLVRIRPIFEKKTNVCKQDIGPLKTEYAENEEQWSQLRRILIQLWTNQWYTHYSIATFLLGTGTRLHESLSLTCVHSLLSKVSTTSWNPLSMLAVNKMRIPTPVLLQKLWSSLQTPLWLSNCRTQSPFSYKVCEWWNDKCSDQQQNVQEIGTYQWSTLWGRTCEIWNWT